MTVLWIKIRSGLQYIHASWQGRRGSPLFPETSVSELTRLLYTAVTQHASDSHAHAHTDTQTCSKGRGASPGAAGRVPEAVFTVRCTELL